MQQNTLCLDIGSGTQDVLYFMPDRELENCPKFVLPAPARGVAKRIQELTAAGRHIFLHGSNMGGGFFRALRAHTQAGLKVATHPVAALAMTDDPAWLETQGISLADRAPTDYCPVHLADFEPGFWARAAWGGGPSLSGSGAGRGPGPRFSSWSQQPRGPIQVVGGFFARHRRQGGTAPV